FRSDVGGGHDNSVQRFLLDIEVPLLHVSIRQIRIERLAHHAGTQKAELAPLIVRARRDIWKRIDLAAVWVGKTEGLVDLHLRRERLRAGECAQLIDGGRFEKDPVRPAQAGLTAPERTPGEAQAGTEIVPVVLHAASRNSLVADVRQPLRRERIELRLPAGTKYSHA